MLHVPTARLTCDRPSQAAHPGKFDVQQRFIKHLELSQPESEIQWPPGSLFAATAAVISASAATIFALIAFPSGDAAHAFPKGDAAAKSQPLSHCNRLSSSTALQMRLAPHTLASPGATLH